MLKRMTIIGVILSFRAMAQEGLREVSWGEGLPQNHSPLRGRACMRSCGKGWRTLRRKELNLVVVLEDLGLNELRKAGGMGRGVGSQLGSYLS